MNRDDYMSGAKIKVIGVGGGGCNAVNRMASDGINGVDFWVANTDKQVLEKSPVKNKLLLGVKLSKGLGAGGNPELGKKAAIEAEQEIRKVLEGTDMLFLAAGMGGGTGTGAIPVVAKIAKEMDILTVGVVTRPFRFEGKRRTDNAMNGIADLKNNVDSIIIIPNDRLLTAIGRVPISDAFHAADTILRQAVQTITDLVSTTAYINLDFADVRTTLKDQGAAMFGIGIERGENRAAKAALKAISSPLLESSIVGCQNAIVNVTGGNNITIEEVEEAVETIRSHAGTEVNIIFGFAVNDDLKDEVIVTIVATGVSEKSVSEANPYSRQTDTAFNRGYEQPRQPVQQQQRAQAEAPEFNSFFRSHRNNNI